MHFAVGIGVVGAHVAGVGHPVQIVIRRARRQRAVVGHDHLITGTFSTQDVHEPVVVDVEQRHVVAVRDPVERVRAVRVGQHAIHVLVNRHAPSAVARGDVDVHVGHHHIQVAVQVQIGGMHVPPKSVGGREAQVHGGEPKLGVRDVLGGGEQFVASVVDHVEVQQAVAVEVGHFKHVRGRVGHQVLPVAEVPFPVVEQDQDPAAVPRGHVVQGGVFDDVQVAVPVHVVDLACRAERAVQQFAHPRFAFVREVPGAVVDEQEVLGCAATAVDSVVHEVQILGAVARQVPGPHRTHQRLVAGQFREPLGRFVRQTQPRPVFADAEVHVQHGLLVERIDDDHVVPRVAVDVHGVNVPCEADVG